MATDPRVTSRPAAGPVAVIVLSWNAADATLACLATLAEQRRPPDYTVLVDNASADDTVARARARFPDVLIAQNQRNLGFGPGMNCGIELLRGLPRPPEIAVLLNQDTLLDRGWLGALVAPFAADERLGAAGCKIRYLDGALQHAGALLEWPRAIVRHAGWRERDQGQYDAPRDYELVTAAAIALRMAALDEVGLFDQGYAPAYFEDVDLCWRLRRAGYRISYQPDATLAHQESLSTRDELARGSLYNRGRLRFVFKTYPFADLTGPFAAAELAFIAEHGHGDEARALRWAYAETLARLPGILAARGAFHPPLSEAQVATMQQTLLGFKRALAAGLLRRVRAAD